MTDVAVIAHRGKSLGGGLGELRDALRVRGVDDPLWFEVPKSKKAPKRVRRALDEGAGLVFVWGGDGMVQRCAHVLAGTGVPMAIVPAGTANLLAANLELPGDVEGAVDVGLTGHRRRIDLGRLNREHFAVMAGAGFDAALVRDVDGGAKGRLGRLAYVAGGVRQLRRESVGARVRVDGVTVHQGPVATVLAGNVGTIFGGVTMFPDARPDDGRLDVAVVTAGNVAQWGALVWRAYRGEPDASRFVRLFRGSSMRVRFDDDVPYELDGGDRGDVDRMRVDVVPGALTVCVPTAVPGADGGAGR